VTVDERERRDTEDSTADLGALSDDRTSMLSTSQYLDDVTARAIVSVLLLPSSSSSSPPPP